MDVEKLALELSKFNIEVIECTTPKRVRCEINQCNRYFRDKHSLKNHQRTTHGIADPNGKDTVYKCGAEGCDFVSTSDERVHRHIKNFHKINAKMHRCDVPGCDREFTRRDRLQDHKKNGHLIGITWVPCPKDGCAEKFKSDEALREHILKVHTITSIIIKCGMGDCLFKTSSKEELKAHKVDIHDVGRHKCQMCKGNKNMNINYEEGGVKYKICRACYKGKTGRYSTNEIKMSNELDSSKILHALELKSMEALQKNKIDPLPDKMYSIDGKNAALVVECDERQHPMLFSYEDDERRTADIAKALGIDNVVVVRWNPENYVFTTGHVKVPLKNRLAELRKLCEKIVGDEITETKHYYMYYDSDNPFIVKNILCEIIN